MDGFHNKVLVIDLDEHSTSEREVTDDTYQKYLGGKGLGTKLLLEHNPAMVDPLAPENHLIFAVGPLTDIKVHGSARYGVFAKSPLTGLYGEAYSGGTVADGISRTGCDAIIVKGACQNPVWLEVSDRGVTFHDAKELWGKDVYSAEDLLKAKATDRKTGVVVIGPGGESLVKFATISNNHHRCAGRVGMGAVLGSKKVKGIVFGGEARRKPADPDLLQDHWKKMMKLAKVNEVVAAYKNFGTLNMVAPANEFGAFPTRYWQKGRRDDYFEKISAHAHHKRCNVKNHACPRCFIACGKMSEVKTGPYKGITIEGPEYETVFSFGGLCLIDTIEEVIYLNDICNRLGIDTISAGNLVAFAMHASEAGAIGEKVEYGDTERVADILKSIAKREGIGEVLADGIVPAAKKWGLEDEAVHVKGLDLPGYDPRVMKGVALGYAVSDRGACHLRATFHKAELSGISPPDELDGKIDIFMDFEDRCTLHDTLILCRFFRDIVLWEELATLVRGATGMDLDKEGLQRIAANVTDLTRIFNLREGMDPRMDSMPKAILDNNLADTGAGITSQEIERLVGDYYKIRGWDENGIPPGLGD